MKKSVRIWLCLPFLNSPFSVLLYVCGHCVEWFIYIALLVVAYFTLETCYLLATCCASMLGCSLLVLKQKEKRYPEYFDTNL